eukprot:7905427-Karenia_brevis.AAC.1
MQTKISALEGDIANINMQLSQAKSQVSEESPAAGITGGHFAFLEEMSAFLSADAAETFKKSLTTIMHAINENLAASAEPCVTPRNAQDLPERSSTSKLHEVDSSSMA